MSYTLEKSYSGPVSAHQGDNGQYGVQFLLIRAVWLLSWTVALLLLMSLGLLLYSSWRYVERIDPIERHLQYLAQVDTVEENLRHALIQLLESDAGTLDPQARRELPQQLGRLRQATANLVTTSPDKLAYAREQLSQFDRLNRFHLDDALRAVREVGNDELTAHQSMVRAFAVEAGRAQRIAVGLAAALLLVSLLLWLNARQRIIAPLKNLGHLMTSLARRDYTSAPVDDADPMLRPLLENYNRLVQRLHKLERAQQQRQESLTDAVRSASHLMMQQQHRLAQAERLGAVGEVAAGVAHELRNPLTSVQMALENLRRDMQDPDLIERADLIMNEVKRATRQLNQLLDQARQSPEKAQPTNIASELEDLITLASYQLYEHISVRYRAEEELVCTLPQARFRQVLLNLILNSGQILGRNAGEISVFARREEDRLVVTVTDTGPGFPAEIIAAGVQAFRSWRVGGTGLGLVMVRRFASDLGGELFLSNRDGGGACVTLSLPCVDCDA